MKIVCDNCSTKYSIADEKVRGKVFKIKCKKCSHIIVVKGNEGAAAEGGAAPPPGGFDQKETRVFDYSGFDGPGGAAPPGGEAVWHLVIDREQVGPLSMPEIQAKWNAGEIDADTYGWREGFGDWQRIGAIDDFAFLSKGGAPAGAPAGGGSEPASLFGSADANSAPTGRADPADLFAAAASAGGDDDGPGDLFGGGRPAAENAVVASAPGRKSVPKDDLFAAAPANGGGGGGGFSGGEDAQSPRVSGGQAMTGQRNENSVLFSLNNLASLATDTAPKSSSGPNSPGFSSGGGSEGSGLIDIRAMAAITLGKKDDGGAPRVGGGSSSSAQDDLPVFSPSAFAAPQAVLLPTGGSQQNNKLIYIVMGVFGLLLVVGIVLLIFILKGNKTNTVASNDTVAAGSNGKGGPDDKGGPDKGGPDDKGGVVPPDDPSKDPAKDPAKDPGTDPAKDPVKDPGTAEDPGKTPPDDPGKDPVKDPKKPHRDPKDPRKDPVVKDPVVKDPIVKEPKPPKNGSCDEVGCAIDPSQACCPKKDPIKKPTNDLPDSLSREDIKSGMASVRGRVQACNDKYKEAGTVDVKISISGDGAVTNATVVGKFAGSPTGGCVESAVKGAKFRKWKGPSVSVKYPFVFR